MRWGAVLLAPVLFAAAHGQELDRSPFHDDATSIGVGKAAFRLRCSACHGIHAEGGRAPALNRGEFEAGDADLDIYRVIAKGVPGTEMPAFGGRNTEENIWRIVAFLRTFEPSGDERVDGDPSRGEGIFWNRGGCGACHRVGRRGGAFGPALTRIGRSRSLAHLRESLLDPGKDLPRGYYVVRVVTREGAAVRGIGLGFDDFSAQLRDASGRFRSFLREEVEAIEREFVSLMPDSYGETLTENEQSDLLAYMQTLRGQGDQE